MVYHKNPLVSVIIPTYNRANVLGRAIHSVLNQTYKNFELIIVDDGSKDNTYEVISSFGDERIVYIKMPTNHGSNPARNFGLNKANGSYIAFLDSDDEWLPKMLEAQIKKFKENPDFGCVYSQAGTMNNGKIEIVMEFQLEGFIYKEALTQGYVSHMITLMVKRDCFYKIGLLDDDFLNCDDDDICLRLAKHYQFGLIREPLAIIDNDSDNRLTKKRKDYADGWNKLFTKHEKDIISVCGEKIMIKHRIKTGILYIKANYWQKAIEQFYKAWLLKKNLLV